MSGETKSEKVVNLSDIMTEADMAKTELPENNDILSREEAVAEALIFASGEPVKIESISIVLNVEKREAKKIMENLISRYEKRDGGIILRKIDNSYQFCTKPELREDLRDYFEKPSNNGLSRAALETLSIICYNQPITRAGIEYVRGVNSDGVLVRLIEKGLVEECGRQEAPGRPCLYGTTVKFLQSVGAESLKDLPQVQKIIIKNEEKSDTEVENDDGHNQN